MPSSRLKEVVSIINDKELILVTEIALDLHEFQYNGFDKDAEISKYNREEFVKKDTKLIVEFIRNKTNKLA